MKKLARLPLALCGGLLVQGVAAQTPLYRDVTGSHLPEALAGACMDAAAGDADGDGDLDLALAMEFQPNVLLLNDGAGHFTDASGNLPRTVHDSEDVAFADFNGDGALDLVWVSEDDRQDELYINDGGGLFSDASDRMPAQDVSNALAVLDLNGDGLPDVLTGNAGSPDRALVNDGRGGFRDETEQRWPQAGDSRTQDLEAADVDGDGDLDVLVANEGQNQLFLQQDGRLADATAANLPVRDDETREIRAADLDGDGDLDLVVANVRFLRQDIPRDYILFNDGSGKFTDADAAGFPEDARSNFTVQVVDADRDGDLDVLAPSTVFATNRNDVLLQLAAEDGTMLTLRAANFGADDVDQDGDMDAIVPKGEDFDTFLFEQGRLTFPADYEAAGDIHTPRTYDFNEDGQTDFAITTLPLGEFLAAMNDADPAAIHRDAAIELFDFGNDGRTDAVGTRITSMSAIGDYLLLLNDGSARFSAAPPNAWPATAAGNGFDIEVADFDGDGLTDLFLCNRASMSGAAAASGGLQRLLFGTD